MSRDQPEWGVERELLAQQLEATAEVVRVLVMLLRLWVDQRHRDKVKVPEPHHVRRPPEVEALHERAAHPPEEHEWPPRLKFSGAQLARRLVGAGGE